MKNMLKAMAGIVLLAALGGIGRSQAQTTYTDSVLKGCYGHLSTSVDTENPPRNKNIVGTVCFDGNGNIIPSLSGVNQTGQYQNLNGVVVANVNGSGTYSLGNPNTPGQGMGTITVPGGTGGCTSVHAFSVNSVDSNGLAHGFQYALIKRSGNCAGQPKVIGGTAYLQP